MTGFFDKMILTRRLRFSDGRIELFDERFAIGGAFISTHIEEINNDPEAVAKIYRCSRDSFFLFFKEIGTKYKFSRSDYLNWSLDIYNFCGWGMVKYEMVDKENRKLAASILDSPTGIFMKGRTGIASDHIARGMIAGGTKAAFNMEIECVETECIAANGKKCMFMAAPAEELKSRYAKLYEMQVDGSFKVGVGSVK